METTAPICQFQLSSWLVSESGVNNSNPWLSTKHENQFLLKFTYPLPAYQLNTHLHQFPMKNHFAFNAFIHSFVLSFCILWMCGICVFMYVSIVSVYTCDSLRSISHVFLNQSPSYVLRQGVSLILELRHSYASCRSSQRAAHILFSLFCQCWD